MDKLWAPWRIKYVQGKKQKECIFCRAAKKKDSDFLVFSASKSICILNIYPYNNGHLMVSPKRHVKDISSLTDKEIVDLFRSVSRAKDLLEKVLRPDGYNMGINLNDVAGAGIPGHIHIHIVPRWKGDTNFMPVLNNTKIISQSLEELHKRLTYANAGKDKKIRR